MVTINKLLQQAVIDGVLECPVCGGRLEPDAEHCGDCGWTNPLVELGFI
ncbi:MAG: hypothetical protein GYA24_13590 [Candidatus Lokiarchaeota archaeon]|nr:hypothetical protein [Candidatus Lokiarchaeota archaeon]